MGSPFGFRPICGASHQMPARPDVDNNSDFIPASFSSFCGLLFRLPSLHSFNLFPFLVPLLFQSSMRFPFRSKQMRPDCAKEQKTLAVPTAAVVSASVIVASSGSTFATSTTVFQTIFSACSFKLSTVWITYPDPTLCLALPSFRSLTLPSKYALTASS